MPSKKILLAVDLDYTHIKPDESWIAEPEFWMDCYADLSKKISNCGFEFIFAVVTKRFYFDNRSCVEVANTFRPFLEKNNPHMFRSKNGHEWCLVNEHGKRAYHCLTGEIKHIPGSLMTQAEIDLFLFGWPQDTSNILPDAVSHFEFIRYGNKSDAVKRIALFHDIPIENTMLLDDSPDVLKEAQVHGILTVSLECFNEKPLDLLNDQHYVMTNLKQMQLELSESAKKIITLNGGEPWIDVVASSGEKNNYNRVIGYGISACIGMGLLYFCFRRSNSHIEPRGQISCISLPTSRPINRLKSLFSP